MKTHSLIAFTFASLLLTLPLANAAERRPIDCGDSLRSQSEIESRERFRTAMANSLAERNERLAATQAVEEILAQATVLAGLNDRTGKVLNDVEILIENPIFQEALVRSLSLSGVKKIANIQDFKLKLQSSPEKQQIEFAGLVVRQYENLLGQAFAWVDEDRFIDLEKRWKMSKQKAFALLNRWNFMSATHSSEIALGVLAWTKVVDSKKIALQMKSLPKETVALKLTDAEDVLITQIKSPHTLEDLAANQGALSDVEFSRKIRIWNALGWTKSKLNMVRYPSEPSFVIFLSLAPVTFAHYFLRDWNVTNTIATIISGVATCPPLIARITKSAIRNQHDTVVLETLTLRQLSEMRRWMTSYPERALELGFSGMENAVDARIEVLRKIRYGNSL